MKIFLPLTLALVPGILLALGGAGAAQSQVPAQTTDDGIHVEFDAPAGCPDAAAFRAELRARTRPATAGKHVVGNLAVSVTAIGKRMSGRLVTRSGGKVVGTRELEGGTCRDVVSALALAAALDLDVIAESLPEVVPPEATELPPSASLPLPPPPIRPAEPSWQLGVGAHGSVTTGVADGLLFGAPVFVDVGTRAVGPLSLDLRLVFEGTVSRSVAETVGDLRFAWWMGALEGCPLRLGSTLVALRPCVRVEAGALTGSPQGVSFGHSVSRPWVSAALVARAEWDPTRTFFLEIEGGVRAPILREQFLFLPGVTLYRVPPVSELLELGAGVHFH